MREELPICPGCRAPCMPQQTLVLQEQIRAYFDSSPGDVGFIFQSDRQAAYRFFTASPHKGWACDACLNGGQALRGDICQQTYGIWQPHLAYVDQHSVCRTCRKAFVFTKEEQKHWYEDLKFWVVSYAVRCCACRQALRERRATIASAQRDIARLRAEFDPCDVEQLERLIALYELTGSHHQVAAYKRRLGRLRKTK